MRERNPSLQVSKQLRYMKELGMVESERQAQWMVYRLADPDCELLTENLKCLQDCVAEELCFGKDIQKRADVMKRLLSEPSACSSALLAEQPPTYC